MGGGMQLELNARLISRIDRCRSTVVDGLRHPLDFESLSSGFSPRFFLIFIDSAEISRFARLRTRFENLSNLRDADAQQVEAYIDKLEPVSSLTLHNDGSLQDLYDKLDRWLETLQQGGAQ